MERTYEAANMASLIDGYCSLYSKQPNSTVWSRAPSGKRTSNSQKSPLKASSRTQSSNSQDAIDAAHARKTASRSSGSGSEPKKKETPGQGHILVESDESRNSDSLNDLKNDFYLESVKCSQIKPDSLSFHEMLGSGQFGDVLRGSYRNSQTYQVAEVAIKKLKLDDDSVDDMDTVDFELITKRFLREASKLP
jgi:hypothetical protein